MNESKNTHNDFEAFMKEADTLLSETKLITLATSSFDKVTARTMSHVNDGAVIMFQTGRDSEKAMQIKTNPNVAFALGNMQIEATTEITGHPCENPSFIKKYKHKFPDSYTAYTNLPDEVLVIANPTKITFYKYENGRPFRHVCLIPDKKVFVEWIL